MVTCLLRLYSEYRTGNATLGARDFSSAVSGFCQVLIVTRTKSVFLAASAYGRRCVGLPPTPKIPAAREKNLWYPGYGNASKFRLNPPFLKFFFFGAGEGGVNVILTMTINVHVILLA